MHPMYVVDKYGNLVLVGVGSFYEPNVEEDAVASYIDALSVPVLAPKESWFKANEVQKDDITAIHVVDKYSVTGAETESWAADEAETGSIMCYVNGTELTISCDRAGGVALNPNSEKAFCGFTNATVFTGQDLLKMERVSRAYQLFMTSGFQELGDDSWNFARVYTMAFAFASMPNLVTVCLGRSTLSKCNSTQTMFASSEKLKNIIAHELRLDNVAVTMSMFNGCTALETINFGSSTFANVATASNMFYGCTSLKGIVWPKATFRAAADISLMFHNCVSLTGIDLSHAEFKNVTTCRGMFSGIDHSTPETGMQLTKIIGIENLDFSHCTDFMSMFYGCHHIAELDLSKWDVSKGTNFSHMFSDTSGLKKLTLDDGNGYAWDPVSAITFNAMFNDCAVETLNISCFASAKAMSLCQMFERLAGTIVGYDRLDTSETTEMAQMFMSTNMEVLDLSGYDTRKVSGSIKSGDMQSEAGFTDMLRAANYLREIRLGGNFDTRGDGTLTEAQAFVLPTPDSAYIPGADGYWYEEDGTQYDPASPPNPALLGRAVTLYAVNPAG